ASLVIEDVRKSGRNGIFIEADVASARGARVAIEQTRSILGGIDVLFNNVGIQPADSYQRLGDLEEEIWDHIIRVNLKSCFLMTKYVIPEMQRRGGGVIINNASVQALQSQPLVGAYAASKGAILALTRNVAIDYAKDCIRAVAVCPGSIDTPMLHAAAAKFAPLRIKDTIAEWGMKHPLGRVGTAEEVAEIVIFLASHKASFVTGEFVCVDGGLMAKGSWA